MSYAELLKQTARALDEADTATFVVFMARNAESILSALAIGAAVDDFDRNYPKDDIYHTTNEVRRGIQLRAAELRKGAK